MGSRSTLEMLCSTDICAPPTCSRPKTMAGQYISTYARMQAKGVRQLVASAIPGSEAWAHAPQQAAALAAAQAEQQGLEMMQAQGEGHAWLLAWLMQRPAGKAQQQAAALEQWPQ